ncbi:MAG TPA: PAS domain-containing protein, partial [Anaerolineae bacterium]|nr:PAS domain-containing protein [Anaerolineae bacterium]
MEKELTSAMVWNLLDDLDEGIIVADANGIVLFKNRAALSLSGLKDE